MKIKKYTLLNFATKAGAEIEEESIEAAVAKFSGLQKSEIDRPFHQSRGLRMYQVSNQIVGVTFA